MTTFPNLHSDDGRATDPAVVGAKAARLALCLQAGLPVVEGFVVPVPLSADAMEVGAATLAIRGSGSARLAVAQMELDREFSEAVIRRAAEVGPQLVVRSSTRVEAQGAWSGAFTSVAEVRPDEVPRAVKGCWSSVFAPDPLQRLEANGQSTDEVGMAVLVQREIAADFGGTARVDPDGSVIITWIAGPPAQIVGGWEPGHTVRVPPKARVGPPTGGCNLMEVVDLARRVAEMVGLNLIEWAIEDDRVWLLQAGASGRPVPVTSGGTLPAEDSRLPAFIRLVASYPGEAVARWVLAWAIGLDDLPPPLPLWAVPVDAGSLPAAIELAAAELVAQRWKREPEAAMKEALETLASLRGSNPITAIERMSELGQPDRESAACLLGMIDGLAASLVDSGCLAAPSTLRHLDVKTIGDLASGRRRSLDPGHRFGIGPWEPVLYESLTAVGTPVSGTPVVGTRGAGLLHMVRRPSDLETLLPRAVIGAVYPINNLSPLLWEASAIVTIGGSPGAHVFEVAASLGVAAVCSADILQVTPESSTVAVAVDGTSGTVWISPIGRSHPLAELEQPVGGGLHCATADVHREGRLEDYFPRQINGF